MTDNVTQRQTKDVAQRSGAPRARETGEVLLPPVDIYEDEAGITLTADLPGVPGDRLNLQVNKDTLLIECEVALDIPEGMQALYAEVRNPTYRRSFALSSELNVDAIQAELKDGVLTVQLPKREAYRPRKIQVQTA